MQIIKIFLISIFSIGSIFSVSAYFPTDALTFVRINNTGSDQANTLILATGTRTILNVDIMTKDGRNVNVSCGTTTIFYQQDYGGSQNNALMNYVCTNKAIYLQLYRTSSFNMTYVNRDRNITPDPDTHVNVSNFPTGFDINNFPSLQPVQVNNFPSLQDVRCIEGCNASATLIFSSSTIEVLTTTAPTFQEWMLVVGVFLAINSIHMWNFLFRRPKTVIKPNKIYR